MDKSFDKDIFAKKLKEIRKGKNLTQDEVCDKCDIDVSNYSKIETGKILPSLGSLYKIAKGLDIEINELFEFEYFSKEAELDAKIQAIYKNYSLKEKQFLYKIMRNLEDFK